MKRRSFIKGMAAAGASALVPVGIAGAALTSFRNDKRPPRPDPSSRHPRLDPNPRHPRLDRGSYDFDEIIDRSGTWSVKYNKATNGEIPMWIADMDFRTDPYVSEALRLRLDRDVLGYTAPPPETFMVVSDWVKNMHGYSVDPRWIGYAPGVITSINQAYLLFTDPGDKIVIQPPVYNNFKDHIVRLGRVAVDNPLIRDAEGQYRMDLEGLENILSKEKPKALVLCNPHNPIGILWDKETLATLAEICDRHGVIVFSDEIHGDFALYGKTHIPFCSVSETAARIGMIFSGPTKAFNLAGLYGTAYCIIPDKEKREKFIGHLDAAKLYQPSIMTIEAIVAAYREDHSWLDSLKEYIEGNISQVEKFLADNDLGIKAVRPQASFLVWLDCRDTGLPQDELMARFTKEAKVIPNDGTIYGPGGEGFVRLNVGCPRSVLDEALGRIAAAFKRG